MEFAYLFATGVVVGVLGSFLGVSGGVIIVPILTLFLNYSIHEAVAISLVVVVANSISISPTYLKSGMANLKLGQILALASVSGSLIGGVLSTRAEAKTLFLLLGISQLGVAAVMWYRGRVKSAIIEPPKEGSYLNGEYYEPSEKRHIKYGVRAFPLNFGIASVSGVLSGLLGVGGGIFIVPALNIIGRLPLKASTATSTLIVGFTVAAGGVIHFMSGNLKPVSTVGMVLGLFLSSQIAVRFFGKVTNAWVNRMFVIIIAAVAVQMIYKGVTFNG